MSIEYVNEGARSVTTEICTGTGRSLQPQWNDTPFAREEHSTPIAREPTTRHLGRCPL